MTVISKVFGCVGQGRLYHFLYKSRLSQQQVSHRNYAAAQAVNAFRPGPDAGPDRILPATSPATVYLDGVVQLRMSEEGLAAKDPISCYSMVLNTVDRIPGKQALIDTDRSWTYEAYFLDICRVARAFIQLGLQPHRTVAIIGNNSPEWFLSAVGAVFAGGLATGVYTTNTSHSVFYQLKHSKTNIAVVEDETQLRKILPYRDQLPDLRAIVMYGGGGGDGHPDVLSWDQLLQLGGTGDETALRDRLEGQAINQPAVICYTSGTTANPKGVLLSQDNLTWTCASAVETYRIQFEEGIMVTYLPLSHIVAQLVDIWLVISGGGTIHFTDKDALKGSLLKHLVAVRPNRFVAVPRVYEKIESELGRAFNSATGVKARLLHWSRGVATAHYDSILAGGAGHPLKYAVANRLVLSKIHARLGLERCLGGLYSGAAPLSPDTLTFLKSIGIIVSEIYGMTEIPNHSANHFHLGPGGGEAFRFGSVGRTAAGTGTKLHLKDPVDGVGEVAANGRNVFMGYLEDPAKTRETFDRSSWLLTGDMASMEDGFISIKGRIKDVIITSGGKNIAPHPIEDRIKGYLPDLVSQCVVVGDRQKHLAALITVRAVIDPVTLEATDQLEAGAWEFCRDHGSTPSSVSDLAGDKDKHHGVYDAILAVVEKVNGDSTSKAAQVRKFTVLPRDFSITGGELGPTMKVKRHAVETIYRDEIEHMYANTDRTSLWDA